MNVFYFNPDNDLAIANGGEYYTPTPIAEQLRRDLQLLPCWLADDGDCVLCDSNKWQQWVENKGLKVKLITKNDLSVLDNVTFRPWGWNPAIRKQLITWGANEDLLPSKSNIEHIRKLAHRRTTIDIHRRLTEITGITFCPSPVELDDIELIKDFALQHPGCYAKEPWSGSGRGVYRALDPNGRDFIQRCQGALNRQGSMLCEVPFERTLDFAVEMECNHGMTTITGYSIFESDFHLQYKSGIVKPRTELRSIITMQYPDFHIVEDSIIKIIDEIVQPHFKGFLGVDMLLFHMPEGNVGINPCVELNMRTTMGAVTAALGERHGMNGKFSICPVEKIEADDILLTPVDISTKFAAIIKQ
ncbi:MAG: hypothetical protein J6S96_10290 [Muribaculaceae bacterium]|nr:hypothetical protein [Muribaculaceae bacterium]